MRAHLLRRMSARICVARRSTGNSPWNMPPPWKREILLHEKICARKTNEEMNDAPCVASPRYFLNALVAFFFIAKLNDHMKINFYCVWKSYRVRSSDFQDRNVYSLEEREVKNFSSYNCRIEAESLNANWIFCFKCLICSKSSESVLLPHRIPVIS